MFSFTGRVVSRYELRHGINYVLSFDVVNDMIERRESGKNEQINSDVIESDEREHQRPNSLT